MAFCWDSKSLRAGAGYAIKQINVIGGMQGCLCDNNLIRTINNLETFPGSNQTIPQFAKDGEHGSRVCASCMSACLRYWNCIWVPLACMYAAAVQKVQVLSTHPNKTASALMLMWLINPCACSTHKAQSGQVPPFPTTSQLILQFLIKQLAITVFVQSSHNHHYFHPSACI